MSDLLLYENTIDVCVGSSKEFLKILSTIITLDPSDNRSVIVSLKPYWDDKTLKFNDLDKLTISQKVSQLILIVENLYKPVLKNKKLTSRQAFIYKQDFCLFFPTARERINARIWVQETLAKYDISSTIKALFA